MIDISTARVGARTTVTLSQDWGIIFSNRKAPCIREANLLGRGERNDVQFWRIEAAGEVQCLELSTFTIGEVPEGFTETVRLPASLHGRFVISVSGIGLGEAYVIL